VDGAFGMRELGLAEAVALGVGIIIGASIFSLAGVGVKLAGPNLPEAFALSAAYAFLIAYSYAKLSRKFISNAGPVEYVVRAFGDNLLVGTLALIYWLNFVFSISLFTYTIAGYALGALGLADDAFLFSISQALIISIFVALNFKGSKAVADTELILVIFKLAVLLTLIVLGLRVINPELLKPDASPQGILNALTASSLFLLSYAGFGVITNASENIRDPEKNVPRAIYLSLALSAVVYLGVSIVTVGTTERAKVLEAEEYALAVVAKSAIGSWGPALLTLGAIVSASTALNSALYGGANVAYSLAKKGELPESFDRRVWFGEPEGLYVTAALALAFSLSLNLEGVAEVTTISLILTYISVVLSHWKLRRVVGGNAAVVLTALVVLVFNAIIILSHEFLTNPLAFQASVGTAVGALIFEAFYRSWRKRAIKARTLQGAEGLKRQPVETS